MQAGDRAFHDALGAQTQRGDPREDGGVEEGLGRGGVTHFWRLANDERCKSKSEIRYCFFSFAANFWRKWMTFGATIARQ